MQDGETDRPRHRHGAQAQAGDGHRVKRLWRETVGSFWGCNGPDVDPVRRTELDPFQSFSALAMLSGN